MAQTLSQIPGTLVYMPPEALDDKHHYGPSLDIFSFGHLALFTLIQVTSVTAAQVVLARLHTMIILLQA